MRKPSCDSWVVGSPPWFQCVILVVLHRWNTTKVCERRYTVYACIRVYYGSTWVIEIKHSTCTQLSEKQREGVVLHTHQVPAYFPGPSPHPESMGWHGAGIPKQSFSHSFRHACNVVGSRHTEITSEIVASGFALEIVPSKRLSGKTIRRFWTAVFSSRATRLSCGQDDYYGAKSLHSSHLARRWISIPMPCSVRFLSCQL